MAIRTSLRTHKLDFCIFASNLVKSTADLGTFTLSRNLNVWQIYTLFKIEHFYTEDVCLAKIDSILLTIKKQLI